MNEGILIEALEKIFGHDSQSWLLQLKNREQWLAFLHKELKENKDIEKEVSSTAKENPEEVASVVANIIYCSLKKSEAPFIDFIPTFSYELFPEELNPYTVQYVRFLENFPKSFGATQLKTEALGNYSTALKNDSTEVVDWRSKFLSQPSENGRLSDLETIVKNESCPNAVKNSAQIEILLINLLTIICELENQEGFINLLKLFLNTAEETSPKIFDSLQKSESRKTSKDDFEKIKKIIDDIGELIEKADKFILSPLCNSIFFITNYCNAKTIEEEQLRVKQEQLAILNSAIFNGELTALKMIGYGYGDKFGAIPEETFHELGVDKDPVYFLVRAAFAGSVEACYLASTHFYNEYLSSKSESEREFNKNRCNFFLSQAINCYFSPELAGKDHFEGMLKFFAETIDIRNANIQELSALSLISELNPTAKLKFTLHLELQKKDAMESAKLSYLASTEFYKEYLLSKNEADKNCCIFFLTQAINCYFLTEFIEEDLKDLLDLYAKSIDLSDTNEQQIYALSLISGLNETAKLKFACYLELQNKDLKGAQQIYGSFCQNPIARLRFIISSEGFGQLLSPQPSDYFFDFDDPETINKIDKYVDILSQQEGLMASKRLKLVNALMETTSELEKLKSLKKSLEAKVVKRLIERIRQYYSKQENPDIKTTFSLCINPDDILQRYIKHDKDDINLFSREQKIEIFKRHLIEQETSFITLFTLLYALNNPKNPNPKDLKQLDDQKNEIINRINGLFYKSIGDYLENHGRIHESIYYMRLSHELNPQPSSHNKEKFASSSTLLFPYSPEERKKSAEIFSELNSTNPSITIELETSKPNISGESLVRSRSIFETLLLQPKFAPIKNKIQSELSLIRLYLCVINLDISDLSEEFKQVFLKIKDHVNRSFSKKQLYKDRENDSEQYDLNYLKYHLVQAFYNNSVIGCHLDFFDLIPRQLIESYFNDFFKKDYLVKHSKLLLPCTHIFFTPQKNLENEELAWKGNPEAQLAMSQKHLDGAMLAQYKMEEIVNKKSEEYKESVKDSEEYKKLLQGSQAIWGSEKYKELLQGSLIEGSEEYKFTEEYKKLVDEHEKCKKLAEESEEYKKLVEEFYLEKKRWAFFLKAAATNGNLEALYSLGKSLLRSYEKSLNAKFSTKAKDDNFFIEESPNPQENLGKAFMCFATAAKLGCKRCADIIKETTERYQKIDYRKSDFDLSDNFDLKFLTAIAPHCDELLAYQLFIFHQKPSLITDPEKKKFLETKQTIANKVTLAALQYEHRKGSTSAILALFQGKLEFDEEDLNIAIEKILTNSQFSCDTKIHLFNVAKKFVTMPKGYFLALIVEQESLEREFKKNIIDFFLENCEANLSQLLQKNDDGSYKIEKITKDNVSRIVELSSEDELAEVATFINAIARSNPSVSKAKNILRKKLLEKTNDEEIKKKVDESLPEEQKSRPQAQETMQALSRTSAPALPELTFSALPHHHQETRPKDAKFQSTDSEDEDHSEDEAKEKKKPQINKLRRLEKKGRRKEQENLQAQANEEPETSSYAEATLAYLQKTRIFTDVRITDAHIYGSSIYVPEFKLVGKEINDIDLSLTMPEINSKTDAQIRGFFKSTFDLEIGEIAIFRNLTKEVCTATIVLDPALTNLPLPLNIILKNKDSFNDKSNPDSWVTSISSPFMQVKQGKKEVVVPKISYPASLLEASRLTPDELENMITHHRRFLYNNKNTAINKGNMFYAPNYEKRVDIFSKLRLEKIELTEFQKNSKQYSDLTKPLPNAEEVDKPLPAVAAVEAAPAPIIPPGMPNRAPEALRQARRLTGPNGPTKGFQAS